MCNNLEGETRRRVRGVGCLLETIPAHAPQQIRGSYAARPTRISISLRSVLKSIGLVSRLRIPRTCVCRRRLGIGKSRRKFRSGALPPGAGQIGIRHYRYGENSDIGHSTTQPRPGPASHGRGFLFDPRIAFGLNRRRECLGSHSMALRKT
jgi:hypothetical protein